MASDDTHPDLNTVREGLRGLPGTREAGQSRQSQIRALLPEIEAVIAAGVKRTAIVKKLNDLGIVITLRIFGNALHRARENRKREEEKGGRKENRAAPRTTPTLAPSTEVEPDPQQVRPSERKKLREQFASEFVTETASNPLLRKKQ